MKEIDCDISTPLLFTVLADIHYVLNMGQARAVDAAEMLIEMGLPLRRQCTLTRGQWAPIYLS